MKKITTILLSTIIFLSCNKEKEIEGEIIPETNDKQLTEEQPKQVNEFVIEDLILLLKYIKDENYLSIKLDSSDFKKKFNGIYVSNELISQNEPKQWIHITSLGDLSSVSFSTALKSEWEGLLEQLNQVGKPVPFEDGTSAKSLRYIDKEFTFETHEPANGVNLATNDLYQVFILYTKK